MTNHTFELTEEQAELIHELVSSHVQALENWVCSAIESDDIDRAKVLVEKRKRAQTLYGLFNMRAKQELAKHKGQPVETKHGPRYP